MIQFPLERLWAETVKPQADKCFMWLGACAALSQDRKAKRVQLEQDSAILVAPSVCLWHLPTLLKLQAVGGIKGNLEV